MRLLQADLCKFYDIWPFETKMYKGFLHPRFWPVLLFRMSSYLHRHGLGIASKVVALLNQILFGCDIARGAQIEGGLYLPHPNGVVIGEYVKIGKNCIIHQGVTLGARGEEHENTNPTVGDEVEIATGAKILGRLHIGDYGRVGANAVVIHDVPYGAVAVGIPARIVRQRPQTDMNQLESLAIEAISQS